MIDKQTDKRKTGTWKRGRKKEKYGRDIKLHLSNEEIGKLTKMAFDYKISRSKIVGSLIRTQFSTLKEQAKEDQEQPEKIILDRELNSEKNFIDGGVEKDILRP